LEDFAKLAAQNISLPYFFHTAETNWPDDLLTSIHVDDPVATMQGGGVDPEHTLTFCYLLGWLQ
jgi:hypothetical protein